MFDSVPFSNIKRVLAEARSYPRSYSLMLHHAQTYFNDKETNKTPMFYDVQRKTLQQIFTIKDIIDRQILSRPQMKNVNAYNALLDEDDDEMPESKIS